MALIISPPNPGPTGPTGPTGATGAPGATGATGAPGLRGGIVFSFSTITTDSDPGNGILRFNNTTIASVTQIFIDDVDSFSTNQTNWFTTWAQSTAGIKSYLTIQSSSISGTSICVFSVTGVTAATGYRKISVNYISGVAPSNTESVVLSIARTGDTGSTGATGATGATGSPGAAGPSNVVLATDDTSTNGTHYPVFVSTAGSNSTPKVSTTKLSFNPATGVMNTIASRAYYADLAENYVADAEYTQGTVLMIGGTKEVTLAINESNKIAGVVTTAPAYLMNSDCTAEFVAAIALVGRVPVRVVGIIRKGDLLISAGDGCAKSIGVYEPKYGQAIGIALENFNGGQGIIEVMVGK
jgi:hypothetical protein